MNFRALPETEAAPLIASVLAAREVGDRLDRGSGYLVRVETDFPCATDYGLSARELGMWGRLRAQGLSDKDAADVVKAARPWDQRQ